MLMSHANLYKTEHLKTVRTATGKAARCDPSGLRLTTQLRGVARSALPQYLAITGDLPSARNEIEADRLAFDAPVALHTMDETAPEDCPSADVGGETE